MNLALTIDQYNPNFVFFSDPIKNTVMLNSRFFRLVYSTPHVSFNGIYLHLHIPETRTEFYYNKMKVYFHLQECAETISRLRDIEELLLQKVVMKGGGSYQRRPVFKLFEQLSSGNFKMFIGDTPFSANGSYVLKIAGVWETESEFGLTYKFMPLRK